MSNLNTHHNWQAAFVACLLGLWLLPLPEAHATVDCLPDRAVPIPDLTLPLETDRASPALVYKTESIELYMRKSDVSEVLSSPAYPRTLLSRALLELPAFTQDMTVEELFERIGPAKPDLTGELRSEQWRAYRNAGRELKFWIEIAISLLLESGRISAKDLRTETPIPSVLRTQALGCYEPVTYRMMDGTAFLEMKDQLPMKAGPNTLQAGRGASG